MDFPIELRGVKGANGLMRAVSNRVLQDCVDVPAYDQAPLLAELDVVLNETAWDVGEPLSMALPLPPEITVLMTRWLSSQGFDDLRVLEGSGVMATKGAMFHHDAKRYANELFCVLWLEDNDPWDLLFPDADLRIPLQLGTIVVFDPANIHGVLARGTSRFDPYILGDNGVQLFASVNFPASPSNIDRLGTYWRAAAPASILSEDWMHWESATLCTDTGRLSRLRG